MKINTKGLIALLAMFALALTGCANAGSETSGAKKVENSKQAVKGNLEVPQQLINAHTIKGPTEAAVVAEPKPLTDKPNPKLPVTIKDFQGTKVTVKDVSRIIPLDIYGSTSQALIALGMGKNIVGRTISDTSASLEKIPVVTQNGHNLNLEALMALKPTLVLMDTTVGKPQTADILRQSGIPVVVMNPDRSDDLIRPQLQMIADALGISELGKKLNNRVEKDLKEVKEYVKAISAKTQPKLKIAMLYVRGTAGIFFIFGKGSAAGPLVEDLNGDDIAGKGGLGEIVPANAEALSKINPDVILVMSGGLESGGGLDGLLARPGVAETTAGTNKRVVSAPDAQLLSFGVSYPLALKVLAEAVYLGK